MSLFVNIKKKYKDFSLSVCLESNGEPLGLLGESGSGKSMTLRCIAGIETPDQGCIRLNDRVFFDSEQGINIPPRNRNIGLLFQNYALFPHMTVLENIKMGMIGKVYNSHHINKLLALFRLETLRNRYPSQLSGGEQQRVAMARLLAYEPEALLLDEPFSALDFNLKDELFLELKKILSDYGKNLVLVSHSKEELYRFCDTIAVMEQGYMMESGEKNKIFQFPQQLSTAKLTGCRNISRAEKVSDYKVNAVDWGICLETVKRVPEDIHSVGIYENHLQPAHKGGYNTLSAKLMDCFEGPNEVILFFRNHGILAEDHRLLLSLPKKIWNACKGHTPEYLYFPKECLLLLQKSVI